MTRYLLPIFVALALIIFGTSCVDNDCIQADRDTVTQTLDISDFDRIFMDLPADVFLTQGTEFEVRVEGPANIIEALNRDVNANRWDITIDGCVRNLETMNIFITMPELKEINMDGSGNFSNDGTFEVDELLIDLDGSGDVDLNLLANDIDIKLDGSGDIDLEGETNTLRFDLDGSGDLAAFDLDAEDVFIRIDGSGGAEVFASTSLEVRINGSGDVRYRGQPTTDITINGSGSVTDAN